MEVMISRRELFSVLKESNTLAITFKSSVDIALRHIKKKLVGSEAELTQNAKNVRLVLSRVISLLKRKWRRHKHYDKQFLSKEQHFLAG